MDKDSGVIKAIRRAYFDFRSPAAYSNIKNVYNEAVKQNADVKPEDVEKYLQSEPTYSLHKNQRHVFKRLKTVPTGLNTDWQCDLADVQQIAYHNKHFRYILVCIDVLSRKIYVAPTKSKTNKDMIPAFDIIFSKAGRVPNKLYSDSGLEFQARSMLDYFENLGIKKRVMYSPHLHAGVVERSIRTLKGRLYRYFTQHNTKKWIDVIDKITDAINNSINRTIGVTPNSVTNKNSMELLNKVYKQSEDAKNPKFKIGDYVRIDKEKGIFGKFYLKNFTEELFRIAAVKHSNPPHYKLEDLNGEEIKGVFYEPELSKTTLEPNQRIAEILKEKKTKKTTSYYVHWIGESDENNQWIQKTDNILIV